MLPTMYFEYQFDRWPILTYSTFNLCTATAVLARICVHILKLYLKIEQFSGKTSHIRYQILYHVILFAALSSLLVSS